MITLQPVRVPRPVPIPIWTDDYADIGERIRRDSRFDAEEIWFPHSDDSWEAFCGRHGTHNFAYEWRQLNQREIARRARTSERLAERARQAQEHWEGEQLRRQQAKQAEADREWQRAERRQLEAARSRQQSIDDNLQYAARPTLEELAKREGWHSDHPLLRIARERNKAA